MIDANDVWEKEWLTEKYQTEIVANIIKQGWAIDELNAGVTLDQLEDLIWRDYPSWAEQYLLDEKEERQLNQE